MIFCSRTHSQLSQFVGELKRTSFARDLRVVALGGRKQLCVHPAVQVLGLSTAIKPFLSHSTTGEFQFSPQIFMGAEKVPDLRVVIKPLRLLLSHSTTGKFNSLPENICGPRARVEP